MISTHSIFDFEKFLRFDKGFSGFDQKLQQPHICSGINVQKTNNEVNRSNSCHLIK